jgi:CHASE2 domain-containing sensor protein
MFKYLFKRDTFFATIAVFLVMGLFSFLPVNTHFLDPIHLALSDFDYNDMAYAKMHKNEDSKTDTSIVIVNIGQASRMEIANMITKIDLQQPKVIGVDVLFNEKKDPVADSALAKLFSSNPKIVAAFNFEANTGHSADTHATVHQPIKGAFIEWSKHKGYANFVGEEEGVVRHFTPVLKEEKLEAFAVAVTKVASPLQYQQLLKRNKLTETINYTRKGEKYVVLDGLDLLNGTADSSILSHKIVLLGYVNFNQNDVEDKHFTPMNVKYTGRTLPDMNGIFIHANIISMIQADDYINHIPGWLMCMVAFLLCWLHMALFIKDYLDNHIWFHLLAKIAQIISAVFFVYLGLLCFHQWDMKVNMTATLVAIILAVDVLYFYEAFATWLHRKYHFKTIFTHKHD